MSTDEKVEANKKLNEGIGRLLAIAESYPDLKANENFKDLTKELSKVEEDIANSRKYYNGSVRQFNDKVVVFPNNIIAGIFGFHKKPMYEIDEAERNNVKVQF